ncbi:MAG: hypothetical protein IJZ04_08140 [Clostridia bacterium]|nr:hypothetical protein [Clostridia bacterium]
MIKKIISLLLALTFLFSVISCGNEAESSSSLNFESSTESSSEWGSESISKSTNDYSESESESNLPSLPEKEMPIEQAVETKVSKTYYKSYQVNSRDLVDEDLIHGREFCITIPSYEELTEYIEETSMGEINEFLFQSNLVLLVNTGQGGIIGFRNFGLSNDSYRNEMNLYLDYTYVNYLPESAVLEEIDANKIFILVIPHRDIIGWVEDSKINIVRNELTGYKIREVGNCENLGNEEKVFLFQTLDEQLNFEAENGISHINHDYDSNMMLLAHYIPKSYPNRKNRIYSNARINENGGYEVDCTTYYEEIEDEINSGKLYYIKVPQRLATELFPTVTLNSRNEVVERDVLTNTSYTDYLMTQNILYGDDCVGDFLPKEYGNYYSVARNLDELSKLVPEGKWTLSSDAFENGHILVVYRYYKNHNYETVGYHSLNVFENSIQITVDEYEISGAENEYKCLSYISIPTSIANDLVKNPKTAISVQSNELEYYEFLGSVSGEKHPSNIENSCDIYVANYYDEFVDFWQDFVGDEIFQKISEDIFKTHFVVAVQAIREKRNAELIGYRGFYIEDEKMHITLDEIVSRGGFENLYDEFWVYEPYTNYEIILVPKELFPPPLYLDNAYYPLDYIYNTVPRDYRMSW